MRIENLTLEITRRCNMKCDHCMRGPAQRLDMSKETISKIFSQIDEIGTITFTGGEPSLKPELIYQVFQELHYRNIPLRSFYVATNAHSTYRRMEFLEALERLYWLSEEQDMCALEVSQDNYHMYLHQPSFKYYNEGWVGEYDEWIEPYDFIHLEARKYALDELINDGRARNISGAKREKKHVKPWVVTKEEDGDLSVSSERYTYISANGNVSTAANISFERADKHCLGNVHQRPLRDIIESNCISEEIYKEAA